MSTLGWSVFTIIGSIKFLGRQDLLGDPSPSLKSLKMYLVESKGGAIECMLLALFFLGTWPVIPSSKEEEDSLSTLTLIIQSPISWLLLLLLSHSDRFRRARLKFQIS
ncbi:hypothetical protein SAY87_013887 [Trapa incisa]|uniref:Uncharacterized protein n=1 Tax=Trapa incisa TaxID=236973 RepID=A0AAN7QDM2_9MYRT|nr:hypothetical protein SAY87_013887 [Trapa incisa]